MNLTASKSRVALVAWPPPGSSSHDVLGDDEGGTEFLWTGPGHPEIDTPRGDLPPPPDPDDSGIPMKVSASRRRRAAPGIPRRGAGAG